MTSSSIRPSSRPRAELASDFAARILLRQVTLGVATTVLVMVLAPWMLMLGSHALGSLWARIAGVGTLGVVGSTALGAHRLRESRSVFHALAMSPEQVDAEAVGLVADVPLALSTRFVSAFGVASALLATPLFQDGSFDAARASSLALLTFATFSATGVVHFVVVRSETIRAIELGPTDAISAWLEHESVRTRPERRIVRKMLLAIVVPVALVGIGSAIVGKAHVRAAAERTRSAMVTSVARVALEPLGSDSFEGGRVEAVEAAAAFGLAVRAVPGEVARGELEASAPAGGGVEQQIPLESPRPTHAVARYRSELPEGGSTGAAIVAAIAAVAAAISGVVLGRALAADLRLVTRKVTSLSTEAVLRGDALVAGTARFAPVADVGVSVARLTERFREFADAQKRALKAKASAQRVKQLLFASVSHDLKSPLNAVLGFCELLRDESMTLAQEESLDMIEGRGRELHAMIETILDAARVEAGQLKLSPNPIAAREFIDRGLTMAFDLYGDRNVDVSVELGQAVPDFHADPLRGPAALGVLIAHAMSEATAAKQGVVRIRATSPGPSASRIDIEHASPRTRPSHLEEQLEGRSPTQTARGAALRLSLARAIVELHGGRVTVARGERGEAVVTCDWPGGA